MDPKRDQPLRTSTFRLSAHPGDFWGVDLENVKAAFLGALDKQQGLRVPVLGPISEVHSNGVHK